MMMKLKTMNFEVKIISPKETKALRHKILWPHIKLEENCNIDIDYRSDGFHIGVFDGKRIISVASFFEMKSEKLIGVCENIEKQYRLRAMATDPEYRKLGVGRMVISEAIKNLRKMEVDVLWCNARKVALGFYENLEFEVIDEWFDVPNIGLHKLMYISIHIE